MNARRRRELLSVKRLAQAPPPVSLEKAFQEVQRPNERLIQITASKGELYLTVDVNARAIIQLTPQNVRALADALTAKDSRSEYSARL
jgi:hypothetical protein